MYRKGKGFKRSNTKYANNMVVNTVSVCMIKWRKCLYLMSKLYCIDLTE